LSSSQPLRMSMELDMFQNSGHRRMFT